jgi:sigma-B regulation protein RsbU (phosphoserine phosphatase)
VLALLERLDAEVALPLLHRGLLLGVILLGKGDGDESFERALASFTTVAIANTHLAMESQAQPPARPTDLSRALVEALLPDEKPVEACGMRLRGVCRLVPACGGDLWTWHDLGGGKLLLTVGDATGHGAASAMMAAVARGALDAVRHTSGAEIDPAKLLATMNQTIHRAGRGRVHVTMFACVVDGAAGKMRFASAGHPFPLAVKGGAVTQIIARGNPLGAVPEAAYSAQERDLEDGERIVVFTDGLVDAGAPGAEPWGSKRLRAAVATSSGQGAARMPDYIFDAVDKYLVGRPIADDISIVALEKMEKSEKTE